MDAKTQAGQAPVAKADRIETLDVLRGVAICGILLMNIPVMGFLAMRETPAFPYALNADWIAWMIQSEFFEGTMRGLFTMLFGAGMLLMLRNAEKEVPQVSAFDVWSRRCWALMFLGIVQFVGFVWPGEILFAYGMTGLFLLAFRVARPRRLIIIGSVIVALMGVGGGFGSAQQAKTLQASNAALAAKAAHKTLTDDQTAAIKAREKTIDRLHPKKADLDKEYKQRTHYPSMIAWSAHEWSDWNMGSSQWYGTLTESLAFMLIGMALYRNGVLTGQGSAATYRWMMIGGYGIGLTARAVLIWLGSKRGYDIDFAHINAPLMIARGALYEPLRLAITLGHIGLLCSLFRVGALGRATVLRAMGRTALTVYSLQSIITTIVFYGFGKLEQYGFATLMGIAVAIWVVTAIFSVLWLKRFEMGPAEKLLRAIAYGIPLWSRRKQAAAVPAAI